MNRFLFPVTFALSASSLLLVDSAVKGAALLTFALLVVSMLRRDSAATRHLVWMVAIVAMLFVPVLSALLPQWRVLPEWATLSTDVKAVDTATANGSDVIDGRYEAHEADASRQATIPPAVELPERETQPSLIGTAAPPVAVDIPLLAKPKKSLVTPWTDILPSIWIVGFLLLTVRLLAARLLLWRIERTARVVSYGERLGVSPPCLPNPTTHQSPTTNQSPATDSELVAVFNSARLQLAVHHRITLLIHPDKTIPVVWGIFRHRLMLPAIALQWSDEQLRSVMLHELAHIKRRDTLAQLLAQIACGLHWFNPLIWFAAWRLHVERERACDDLVLASGVRASAYAEHLLNVASKLSSSSWTHVCGLAMARSSSLHGRLAAVLSEKRNRRNVSTSIAGVCVLLAATILIPVAMLGAVDENLPGQAATPATQNSATATPTANEESAMKLPPGIEEHLDWSEQVNGLRAAVRIRTMDSPGIMGKERKIFIVIQNISDKPIRFCDTAIQETDVPAADTEGRNLYLQDNGETLLGIQRAVSMRIDLELQPREVLSVDMLDAEKTNDQRHKSGDLFAEGIVKVPSRELFAVLNIIHAPDGAWTGKLKTPPTRGAFAADGPMPKSKEGQALFRYGVDHARLNNQIPGGLIHRLHDKVLEFIQLNDGDQFGDPYAKKMQPLVARFEKTGDWNQADVVALFDDIAVVTTIPLDTTLDQIRERTLQRGQRLPASFEKANWGEPLPGGLRMAWVLEPGSEKHHLGSPLKSRVMIHNSGKEPVAFVTRSFHQPEHKATTADGTGVQMESTYWTTIGRPEPYRLHPGEYCEVHAPGIGIGPRSNDDEDWANIRPGSWILANEDDEIVFQPGDVVLSGDHNAQVNPNWWLEFIKERLNRDAPLPADPKEREVILFRVVKDLFGNSPSPEEAEAFYSDMSPEAVDNFAQRLSNRSWLTSVAGPIQGGETKFRVLPEDPDAATRIRMAMNPGRYNLGENIRFVVTRRPIGERIVNEASITWYPNGQDSKSHNVPLPDGYDSWAAAWSPGSTVLWVQQKSAIHSYDFTDPAEVKEAAVEPDKVPVPIRDAFPAAFATQEKPAAPKPAAAPPATNANVDDGQKVPSVVLNVSDRTEVPDSTVSVENLPGRIPTASRGVVSGRLLLPDGTPAQGYAVQLTSVGYFTRKEQGGSYRGRGLTEAAVETDENGRFSVSVPDVGNFSTLSLQVSHNDFVVRVLEATKLGDLGTIQLLPPRFVTGRVLSAEGLPIANADLRITMTTAHLRGIVEERDPYHFSGVVCGRITTDDQGQFTTPPLEPGVYAFLAKGSDGGDPSIKPIFAPHYVAIPGAEILLGDKFLDGLNHSIDSESDVSERFLRIADSSVESISVDIPALATRSLEVRAINEVPEFPLDQVRMNISGTLQSRPRIRALDYSSLHDSGGASLSRMLTGEQMTVPVADEVPIVQVKFNVPRLDRVVTLVRASADTPYRLDATVEVQKERSSLVNVVFKERLRVLIDIPTLSQGPTPDWKDFKVRATGICGTHGPFQTENWGRYDDTPGQRQLFVEVPECDNLHITIEPGKSLKLTTELAQVRKGLDNRANAK